MLLVHLVVECHLQAYIYIYCSQVLSQRLVAETSWAFSNRRLQHWKRLYHQ